jgi:hypothetical protein
MIEKNERRTLLLIHFTVILAVFEVNVQKEANALEFFPLADIS